MGRAPVVAPPTPPLPPTAEVDVEEEEEEEEEEGNNGDRSPLSLSISNPGGATSLKLSADRFGFRMDNVDSNNGIIRGRYLIRSSGTATAISSNRFKMYSWNEQVNM